MQLEKLDREIYIRFIISLFKRYKKRISPVIAGEIVDWACVHTYYVQHLCNRVFAETKKEVPENLWKQQAYLLLKEQELMFFAYRNLLTHPQWMLLKAVAHDEKVYKPTAHAFLKKHQLGSSATVLRSLKVLQDNELVYSEFDQQGVLFYSVYDVFFHRWTEGR